MWYLPSADLSVLTEVDNSSALELLDVHGLPVVIVPRDLSLNAIGGVDEVRQNSQEQQATGGEGHGELGPTELPGRQDGLYLKHHVLGGLIQWVKVYREFFSNFVYFIYI